MKVTGDIPRAFGMSPPRVRLQTPGTPDLPRDAWGDRGHTTSESLRPFDVKPPADHSASSLGFDLLFDTLEETAGDFERNGPMPMLMEEDSCTSSDDGHDRHAVYVRLLRQLTKHKTDAEADTYKRFAAACAEVGPGEVGDFAHIEAVRCAFDKLANANPDDLDVPLDHLIHGSKKKKAEQRRAGGFSVGSNAFVATTPGAAGHAALLNLRHSFLWIKTGQDASTDTPMDKETDESRGLPVYASASATPMKPEDATSTGVLLMEPYLRAHFVISRPTERYERLLDTLPPHFVGSHKRLAALVDFMSEQMLASFKERGMPVPPWRQNKSILSKWFLPTATSRSQPTTPAGSPPAPGVHGVRTNSQSRSRRASVNFDVVGGSGVFFGVGYGVEPYGCEGLGDKEKKSPPVGSLSSLVKSAGFRLRDAVVG